MTGVSLGRFNPCVHLGHQRVIDAMIEEHGIDNSLIMIGSANKFEARNPLTYPQRRHIAETLFPEVEIMPLADVSTGDADFEATMEAWQQSLLNEEGIRETKFEFYGGSETDVSYMQDDFATQNLGRTEVVPFSGTEVRAALNISDRASLETMVDEKVVDLTESYYRFQVAQLVNPVKPFGPFHLASREVNSSIYPNKVEVPDDNVFWETSFEDYAPEYFVHPAVQKNDMSKFPTNDYLLNPERGWAHPEEVVLAESILPIRESFLGKFKQDEQSRPLNPMGRTGIMGRGLLGKWGPNLAVDPMITRHNPETGVLELLIIQRRSGAWGFPGGFVDRGDTVEKTLSKELGEEAGVYLDMDDAERVYEGYVDSSRNTDNAWVETVAAHKHFTPEQAQTIVPVYGDDAIDVKWLNLEDQSWPEELVGTHAHIANMYLQNINL